MKKYEEFINALQYVDQGDNKSAYDKLTELINDNLELENKTLYYDALYARASLDIANLNLHIDDSIEDLKILIANRTRYVKESYSLATLVYDHLEMPDEVIEYGTKALELDAPFTSEIAYALAKAYASRGTKSSYLEALKYIDTCIDNADEELNNVVDFLICKTDILISLNLTDQALSLIDEMMAKYGASETLYYLKSRAYYCKYDEDPVANKEYLDMAIDNLKICLQYDEKDLLAISLLVELYTIKKDKDRAFELIDKLDDGNHTEYIVLEKAKFYDEVGEYEEGRDLVLSFDKYQDNWKLVYTLGVFNKKLNNLEEARKYFIGPEQYLRSALFKYLFAGENIHKKIKYLSGGEKVRLKIFCLIQDSYNFLILDEPTNHIDIDTREMLEESLKEFTGTILFVSHDRYFINKIATSIIEIKNKNITRYIGNYDDYREKINKI